MKNIRSFSNIFDQSVLAYENLPLGLFAAQKQQLRDARQKMEEVDQSLLRLLTSEKYFSYTPHVIHRYERGQSSLAVSTRDGWGHVVVCLDRRGRPSIPLARHHDHNATQFTLDRWFCLLHEAAHCEFELSSNPFRPSVSLPVQQLSALNNWVFHPIFRRKIRNTLNEAFADAYACMILLRQQQELSSAFGCGDVVREIVAMRSLSEKEDCHKIVSKNIPLPLGEVTPYLACADAISNALSCQDQWMSIPSEQIFDWACRCASDALVSLMVRSKDNIIGQSVKDDLSFPPQYNTFFGVYGVEVLEQTHHEFLQSMDKLHENHPGWAHVRQVLEQSTHDIEVHAKNQEIVLQFANGKYDDEEFHLWLKRIGKIIHQVEMQSEVTRCEKWMQMMDRWQHDKNDIQQAVLSLLNVSPSPAVSSRALTP